MTTEQEQLKAYYEDILSQPCTFKVGDWVTPTETSKVKGRGEPHLVVQTYDAMQFHNNNILGHNTNLTAFDMLVLCIFHGAPLVYVAESTDYEEYHGDNV